MCPSPGTLLGGARSGQEKPRPIRRFAARVIDMLITWTVLVTAVALLARGTGRQSTIVLSMATAVCWMFVESFLISRWRTTPGKWLLKSYIEKADGGAMTYRMALDRSFALFTWGLGCMIPPACGVCMAVGYEDLRSCGATRWDRGRFRVEHAKLGPGRWAIVIAVLILLVVCASVAQELPVFL